MNAKDPMQTTSPSSALLAMPFEGSPRAAELIAALQDFLQGELAELAQKHGISLSCFFSRFDGVWISSSIHRATAQQRFVQF